jgi:hypothetical protein
MDKIRSAIIDFAHELEEQHGAAFDLWTWLPSYKEAEKYHNDYACEYQPSVRDILIEATMYIADLKELLGVGPGDLAQLTDKQINDASDFYKCPCGEHD